MSILSTKKPHIVWLSMRLNATACFLAICIPPFINCLYLPLELLFLFYCYLLHVAFLFCGLYFNLGFAVFFCKGVCRVRFSFEAAKGISYALLCFLISATWSERLCQPHEQTCVFCSCCPSKATLNYVLFFTTRVPK